ncbi:MAG: hypothetical protein K0Q93_3020 [Nocardioidaceae bacterium]|jgi:hypothetical protein|nr:hypothetical protein [Nocardioidaceae bacterium]
MDEHTTGKHSSGENAYDLIRRQTGTVWVKPDHHRHAETFTGDLSDTKTAVA